MQLGQRAPPRVARCGRARTATRRRARYARLLASASSPQERRSSSALQAWEVVGRPSQQAWVRRPSGTAPFCVAHFVGGAFAGAAPQLTYGLFLERLAEHGVLVVATPFKTGLDHHASAEQVLFAFDAAKAELGDEVEGLPVFGVGHSLGALLTLLACARFLPERAGNVLMSFNNSVAKAVPLFSPAAAPLTSMMAPVLAELGKSYQATKPLRAGLADAAGAQLREVSPPIVREMLPLAEQLEALAEDFANAADVGNVDFNPTPEDAKRTIRARYGVRRNLLVRFREDAIDETDALAYALLANGSAVGGAIDLRVVSLPGTHVRPNQQRLPEDLDVPPEVAEAAAASGAALQDLAESLPGALLGSPLGTLAQDAARNARELGGAIEAASTMQVRGALRFACSYCRSEK